MAETGARAHRCGDCAGCRRRNDGGCGRCLMCLKKRHGSDAQGRQSCANHWCSQMRAYDDKGPVQGLAGWSVIAIPRVADGEDYYYLSPEGGRLRSRPRVLITSRWARRRRRRAGTGTRRRCRRGRRRLRRGARRRTRRPSSRAAGGARSSSEGPLRDRAARAAESGSPPAPAPPAPAPSVPAPSAAPAPAPRAPPPRSAPAPAMAPAPAPASREARARARRDDREFDGLGEAIRRSMEEVGAPAPAPPAPRDEGTLEPRVDGDWEATARKLLREIKDEQARNPGSGNGQVNLEGLRPTLTRCGFSGTPPPWRAGYCAITTPANFPKKSRIRSLVQLVNYLEGALGEDEDEEDEEEDDEANNEDDEVEAPPPPQQPPQPRRRALSPRAMDLARLSEKQLREEANRRKLGPLPSDGKPSCSLLQGG